MLSEHGPAPQDEARIALVLHFKGWLARGECRLQNASNGDCPCKIAMQNTLQFDEKRAKHGSVFLWAYIAPLGLVDLTCEDKEEE